MRTSQRLLATTAVLALALTACGGTADPVTEPSTSGEPTAAVIPDGPTIVVGSFNFGESQILGNIYAQVLIDAGYSVETKLDLGSREVIFSQLEDGSIGLLPEYVGSALSVGFGGSPTGDLTSTLADLTTRFDEIGVSVLEPAPGQDANVYVVTQAFADEFGVTSIADLANVDRDVVMAGAPECKDRETCFAGFTGTYGLDNVTFESIQEGSVRVSSLKSGAVDVAGLFSTQPVIAVEGFVALTDPEGIVPVENIVPVVSKALVDAYGQDLVDLINSVSAKITTEVLISLNGKVELDAEDAEDVAATWLKDNGFLA